MTKNQIIKFAGATLLYWGYMYVAGSIGGTFYGKLLLKIFK